MSTWLAGLLVTLFFSPLGFVYGRVVAGKLHVEARRTGRALPALALWKLVLPAIVAPAFLLRLSGLQIDAMRGWIESGTVRMAVSALWLVGSLAAVLFFLTVPFVLGRVFGVTAALLGYFRSVDDDPLSFGARRAKSGETTADERAASTKDAQMAPLTIAIDGPAAAGKGTLAKRLADHYGLAYLDTGLLYRAIGKLAADRGVDLDDGEAMGAIARDLDTAHLDDGSLRGREVGELASRVAVHRQVRRALDAFQREFAARPDGAVLDGRDIGTVICPDARVKIFVTASPQVRARRRTDELLAKGREVDYATILSEVVARDARDAGRASSPLKPAADAHLLDTSEMGIEAAFRAACDLVDETPAPGTTRRSPPFSAD